MSEGTFYKWKAKYAGLTLNELKRLRSLEEENRRLKQIVAQQALDNRTQRRHGLQVRRPSRQTGQRLWPGSHREPEYYPILFEATVRVYRHHGPDIPTIIPTQMIGCYGLTWDYTVMKLLNCPISEPKTGFHQTCRVPGYPAFCWLPTLRLHSSLKGKTPKEFADSMAGLS